MNTKLTLFVTVLAAALFGMGCASTDNISTPTAAVSADSEPPTPNPNSDDPFVKALAHNKGDIERAIEELSPYKDINNATIDIHGRLVSVHLNDTPITDEALIYLGAIPTLQGLGIGNTKITGQGLNSLIKLNNLKSISIAVTSVSDDGLAALAKIPNLETVTLTTNPHFTDKGWSYLKRSKSIKHLDLIGVIISDKGLSELSEMKQLRSIALAGRAIPTPKAVAGLRKALPKLAIQYEFVAEGFGRK